MQIARRGFEVRVTQQGLNHEQVHSLVQQMRCKRAAQRMWMNRFGNAGLPRRLLARSETLLVPIGRSGTPPGKSHSVGRFQRQYAASRSRKGSASITCLSLWPYLRGWIGYFGKCETPSVLEGLEQWFRRRLRSAILETVETGNGTVR